MKSLLICVVLLELVWFGNGQSGDDHHPLAPAFFVFGDSLVDSGNNNYIPTLARANYFPYGIDFGFPTGRFCNGRTVVDYGATYLGLPLVPPYLSPLSIGQNSLRGVNYASAAAGILDETGQHYGARTTFNGQISQFEITIELHLRRFFQNPADLRKYLAKSIIGINIGSNDYINNYLMPERYSTSQTYKTIELRCKKNGVSWVRTIRLHTKSAIYVLLSAGLVVSNEACCRNGRYGGALTCLPLQQPCLDRQQYVFWDAFHPTETANKIIAHNTFSKSANYSYPISVYELAKL
ncbi:PREDICTED: GDSL esterase/lipase 7-like [Camelina sativa]|uniref:GDSL esterase/lipase 7-like n=1 Tax=Camelina sativa TaxID=90675 RepID=A0ABM1QBQ5_CAMSA|nr:PREDICTED: GDSL esterase/lipase 7-like [Camelina sativa]